jgi:hypothetical protein
MLVPVIATLAAAQTTPQPPPPPESENAPDFKISGLVFGDYYYIVSSHRDELEEENGFRIRRLYFTYDHPLSETYSLRVRLEANSEGDFESTGALTAYLKDAWLKRDFGAHELTMGLASTPNIEFIDRFQGYRSVEKSPLDLYRWDSSRDLGLLMSGGFGEDQRTRYSFQFGNGSGTGSETNASKSVRGQLIHESASGLVLEGYADWQNQPEDKDISTFEAVVGCKESQWRASLQYGHQERLAADSTGSDLSLDFLSAFAAIEVSPRVAVLGRVDGNLDPLPNGGSTDYFPFSEDAESIFALAGLDFTLGENVHLIPNVEFATYGEAADGSTPGTDVMPRVTLFFTW